MRLGRLDGETTANFGPGITVTLVHVIDPTHVFVQVTVAFNATTGFRPFTIITDGDRIISVGTASACCSAF